MKPDEASIPGPVHLSTRSVFAAPIE